MEKVALSTENCNNEVNSVGGGGNRIVDTEADFEMSLTGLESEMEQQLIKLFRRLALPFKKANRRLRDMEDIGRQLESTMDEIRTSVQIAAADFDQKFNDFFNMTLEMFEHQHHQIALGEKTLAGIKLCCSGTASDLSDFKAKTESVLDKIESGSLMSPAIEDASRSRAALRFESERILSALKDHENLLIDGFDSCSSSSNIISNEVVEEPTENYEPTEITLTVPPITSTEASTMDSVVTAALVEGHPQRMSEVEKVFKTCEQLLEAGFLENKEYTVDATEDSNFRKRFCDQTSSGGGWTVPRASIFMSLSGVIVIACLFNV